MKSHTEDQFRCLQSCEALILGSNLSVPSIKVTSRGQVRAMEADLSL
jgi:hypothetical protein